MVRSRAVLPPDSSGRPPPAAEVFAGLPPPLPDDAGLRESVRAMRAEDGLLLGVLDDDPTGSQAVHDVQAVTVLEEDAYQAALAVATRTCFVLTNTRSLGEAAAAELNTLAARGLMAVAGRRGARLQLVSRSDSTLRGHVMAEVAALQAVRRDLTGRGYDGVLLVPAFGYTASDLREFVAQKSGGAVDPAGVASLSLADIRLGGPDRVRGLLARVQDGAWVVVNATEYSDLETVARGVLLAGRDGKSFLFRTGPSFVRALAGLGPKPPLRGRQIWPSARRGGHGLVVAGSHTDRTNRQLAALRTGGGTAGIELDVPAVMAGS